MATCLLGGFSRFFRHPEQACDTESGSNFQEKDATTGMRRLCRQRNAICQVLTACFTPLAFSLLAFGPSSLPPLPSPLVSPQTLTRTRRLPICPPLLVPQAHTTLTIVIPTLCTTCMTARKLGFCSEPYPHQRRITPCKESLRTPSVRSRILCSS